MKVTGDGLRLSPTTFEVSVPPKQAALIKTPLDDQEKFKMQDIVLPPMYAD